MHHAESQAILVQGKVSVPQYAAPAQLLFLAPGGQQALQKVLPPWILVVDSLIHGPDLGVSAPRCPVFSVDCLKRLPYDIHLYMLALFLLGFTLASLFFQFAAHTVMASSSTVGMKDESLTPCWTSVQVKTETESGTMYIKTHFTPLYSHCLHVVVGMT